MEETFAALQACSKKVEKHLANYQGMIWSTKAGAYGTACEIKETEGEKNLQIVCGIHYTRKLSFPKNPWKRCDMLKKFLERSYDRWKAKKDEPVRYMDPLEAFKKGLSMGYTEHFETIGWIPEDISGKDCKPIQTEAVKTYEQCLTSLNLVPGRVEAYAGEKCTAEGDAAEQSIERTRGSSDTTRGTLLGSGVHRKAFSLGQKCVMKLARGDYGAVANLNEIRDWNKLKSSGNKAAIKMFLPIASYHPSGAWTIVPKISAPKGFNRAALTDELANVGITCNDLHEANWGRLKNRLVVIDYGFGLESCNLKQRKRVQPKGLSQREQEIEAQLFQLRQMKEKVRGMQKR